jgi:small acid-soluble spore protein P (minor)
MGKPDSIPVPNPDNRAQKEKAYAGHNPPQEPLPGSKKVKQANHSRHNNGEG